MTTFNKQGVLMDKWYKTPNALVDDITGDIISTQASVILQSILRLTEGVLGREWATIPHTFFMRKTQAKRRETIAKYVKELTDNELINVNRQTGKVTAYSVNWKCNLWYSVPKLTVKAGSSVPVRLISTCTFHPYMGVRFIRTCLIKTSTFHPYTYKDITTKDNLKDNKIETEKKPVEKKEPVKPKAPTAKQKQQTLVTSLFNKWLEVSGQNIKSSKPRLAHINARLNDGFTETQIIDAMTYVATDSWHISNGQNTIEIAIRSTAQIEKKLIKINSLKQNKAAGKTQQNNKPDPLAVNQKWHDGQVDTSEERRQYLLSTMETISDHEDDDYPSFYSTQNTGVMKL